MYTFSRAHSHRCGSARLKQWLRSWRGVAAAAATLALVPAAAVIPTATAATGVEPCGDSSNFGVYLYSDINMQGRCSLVTSSAPDLRGSLVGNDSLSSLTLYAKGTRSVLLYRDINYTGPCQATARGIANLIGQPIGNDQVSSLKLVEPGWVTVETSSGPQCKYKPVA